MPRPCSFLLGDVFRRPAAPALTVRMFRGALHARVALTEKQRIGGAHFSPDQAEIGRRIEEDGVPASPRGKYLLDLFTQRHGWNPVASAFEPIRATFAWQTERIAIFEARYRRSSVLV